MTWVFRRMSPLFNTLFDEPYIHSEDRMTLSLATITVSLLLRGDPDGPAKQPTPKALPFGDELQTLVNWLSFVAILARVVGVVVAGARMAIAWRGGGEANVAQLARCCSARHPDRNRGEPGQLVRLDVGPGRGRGMPAHTQQPEYAGPRADVDAAELRGGGRRSCCSWSSSASVSRCPPVMATPHQRSRLRPGRTPLWMAPALTITGSAGAGQDIGDGPGGGSLPAEVPTVALDGVRWQLFGVGRRADECHRRTRARLGHDRVRLRSQPRLERRSAPRTLPSVRGSPPAGRPGSRRSPSSSSRAPIVTGSSPPCGPNCRRRPNPVSWAQIAGFLYQSYSSDTAVIGLVLRAPGAANTYATLSLTLQWRDGDWKMVAPPGGTWRLPHPPEHRSRRRRGMGCGVSATICLNPLDGFCIGDAASSIGGNLAGNALDVFFSWLTDAAGKAVGQGLRFIATSWLMLPDPNVEAANGPVQKLQENTLYLTAMIAMAALL